MKAVVTGASSGIGRDIARELAHRNIELVLVARSETALRKLQLELPVHTQVIVLDLSKPENCYLLHQKLKGQSIDILVNNAGYGIFGRFVETSLEQEINLIDLNVKATHILTKLFMKDFVKHNHGYLLNVASSAAYLPGPLLSSYYASKSYVLRLTQAVYGELRKEGSKVSVSVLCPGPVQTHFNERAGVRFSTKSLRSAYVARYAVCQMFQKKLVIMPGMQMKAAHFMERFLSDRMLIRIVFLIQHKKGRK